MSMYTSKRIARLELVIEFEELPYTNEIEGILEVARGHGFVTMATFRTYEPITKDYVKTDFRL